MVSVIAEAGDGVKKTARGKQQPTLRTTSFATSTKKALGAKKWSQSLWCLVFGVWSTSEKNQTQ
jgi:hypothetical protein